MASEKNATILRVQGRQVSCPMCGHDRFWSRQTLMNSRAATFFKLDWANKAATNQVCDSCGYVLWFLDKQ